MDSSQHKLYADYSDEWKLVRDVIRGEKAVKGENETYLPKTLGMAQDGKEGDTRYAAYKLRADLPEIVEPAIDASVGLITNRKPTFIRPDGSQSWELFEECATPLGETLLGFHAHLSRELSSVGRGGFIVNIREEPNIGVVPVFAFYETEKIVDWSYGLSNGKKALLRLVLEEVVEGDLLKIEQGKKPDETKVRDEYTLEPIGVVLKRYAERKEDAGKSTWIEIPVKQPLRPNAEDTQAVNTENGGVGYRLNEIPFVPANAERISCEPGRIPFLGLARNCLSRYRLSAGYYEAISFYEPTPYVTGLTAEWIDQGYAPNRVGAGALWHLPAGAQAGMLEYTGPSIENMRQALIDLETQALRLALQPFEQRYSESGTAHRERRQDKTTLIYDLAQTAGRAINNGLAMAASWLGEEANKERLWFRVEEQLSDEPIDPNVINSLIAAWQVGALSKETMHENFQRKGITHRSYDDEQRLIDESDPLSGQVNTRITA